MKTCLVLAALASVVLLAACTGKPPSRCSQWGWYCPCDLIEGQGGCAQFQASTMRNASRCDPCGYQAGQVVSRQWAYPAEPCAAPDAASPAAATGPVAPMPQPPAAEPVPAPAAP